MVRTAVLIALILTTTTPCLAQVDWLPPDVERAAAGAMVARFAEAGVEIPGSEQEKLQGALMAIRDLTATIDSWGLDGLIERAPDFSRVQRPDFDDPIVATIADYGLCALPLHPELVSTQEEKLTVVLGEYTVMLVSAYLRDRFLAGGGTDDDLRNLLATEQMDKLSYDIQVDEELRQYVVDECGPMFEQVFQD